MNKLLLQRIKFITTNFQLQRRKSNVFIGVYFSNEFLNASLEDLKTLDKNLESEVNLLPDVTKPQKLLKSKLKKLSFEQGFNEKRIVQFKIDSFKKNKILKIWTNL